MSSSLRKLVGCNIITQFRHRLCNTNDSSNLFTKSLFQFRPRFFNTNGQAFFTFQEAPSHAAFAQFVNAKTDFWHSKRRALSDSSNARTIWPSRLDEKDDCLSLDIEMPGVPEEDIKVSVQHNTVVIEGPGDERFLAIHPFEKYLCWVDLEYDIYNFSGIKAEMKRNKGVLRLTVPKLKQEEVRAFDLKVNFVDKLD